MSEDEPIGPEDSVVYDGDEPVVLKPDERTIEERNKRIHERAAGKQYPGPVV